MLINNMIYKLLAIQIVSFWDAIKYAVVQTDEVSEKNIPKYFNELLQALLSDKAQCFVTLNESKILQGVCITRIVINKVQLERELHIQSVYSIELMNDRELQECFGFIVQFAKKEGCSRVTYDSRNPQVWQISKVLNCTECYRSFALELGE